MNRIRVKPIRRVNFLARGAGYGLFLTPEQAVLTLHSPSTSPAVVRMQLAGANRDAAVSGASPLPGKSSYFVGNDPAKWHRDIPQFARVRYQDVYPGVDLVYYGNQGQLEYDFEVAPGLTPVPSRGASRGKTMPSSMTAEIWSWPRATVKCG